MSSKGSLEFSLQSLLFPYSSCYFVFLSVAFQLEYPCSGKCWLIVPIKALVLSGIWTIILLLDGRYLACLYKPSEENLTTNKPSTEQPSDYDIISQFSGLAAILLVAFVFFLYKLCCPFRDKRGESGQTHESRELTPLPT